MDDVLRRMGEVKWSWADKDPRALAELEGKIKRAGRKKTPVSYSDLALGVLFKIPTLNNGEPFTIDTHNWSDLDRAFIGEFLGYISMRSYKSYGFMASA